MSLNHSIKKKTYFLCPISESIHPPPEGPLCLGSILRSISTPESPLNKHNAVTVENLNPPVVETNWIKTITEDRKPRSKSHEEFLQFVKRASGAYIKHSKRTKIVFEFDTVTTISFEPTPLYVAEAVKTPAVTEWLREPKQRLAPVASLYLVTGMKLAKGAKVKYSASVTTTARGRTDTEGLTPIYGLGLRSRGDFFKHTDDEMEFERESEFVFAFRVKRLRFGREFKLEEFCKGALLEDVKDGNGSEIEPILADVADGSIVGNDSDDLDLGNDSDDSSIGNGSDDSNVENDEDGDNVGNNTDDDVGSDANGSDTGNNAAGASIKNDADSSGITSAKFASKVAKNSNFMRRGINKIFNVQSN